MTRALLLSIVMMFFTVSAHAESLPMGNFERIPVQHEGRIKPLDTFARVTLKTLSGSETAGDLSATEWLAETMLDPLSSTDRPVFLIRDATTRHRLGLTDRKKPLYSYRELTSGLTKTINDIAPLYKKDPKALTRDERALLKVHDDAITYTQILRTLSLILPLNIEIPKPWSSLIKIQTNHVTYLDLRKYERDIEEATRKIILKKGDDPAKYTEAERATAMLGYQMRIMGDAAYRNQLIRIIPVPWPEAKGEWQSPWSVLQQGQGSPDTGTLLNIWSDIATAWQSNNLTVWTYAAEKARTTPLTLDPQSPGTWKLNLEVLSNQIDPLTFSTLLYGLSFLLILGFFISDKAILRRAAFSTIGTAAVIHILGIVVRIILLGRPPVSTLYESLIFVGLICVAIGGLIEAKTRSGTGIFSGAVAGMFIGLLSISFGSDGDTLQQLSAVLNTSFWLATHVLCITIGYGWCVITALLAHISLAQKAFRPATAFATNLEPIAAHTGMIALLFTAIGTILGGIWADQSWGRFWGWDPKENGALLIVLWLVWIQHGALSGHMNKTFVLAAQAFLAVVVAGAWLGVNLLGVGLHSYGFADGLFWGLGLFTAIEMLYIAGTWYLIANPKLRPHAP